MRFFKRKKDSVLDLTKERYKKEFEEKFGKNKKVENQNEVQDNSSSIPFFGDSENSNPITEDDTFVALSNLASTKEDSSIERKKKLGKRLLEITERLEEISNQIYHLQQRIEVVERKLEVNRF